MELKKIHTLAEIVDVKVAKEKNCMRVILVTNELTPEQMGLLASWKNETVPVQFEEVPRF